MRRTPHNKENDSDHNYEVSANGIANGFQRGWLHFDRRNFSQLLCAWQEATHPGDIHAFVRDTLGLDGLLSHSDAKALLTGEKAPSKELANYLSALVPSDLSTALVMQRRGHFASLHPPEGETVVFGQKELATARLRRLKEMAAGRLDAKTASTASEEFLSELHDRLAERFKVSDLDMNLVISRLAVELNVKPDSLLGRHPLPSDKAKAVAETVASLLGLEGDDFDGFASKAQAALSSTSAEVVLPVAAQLGRMIKFLRASAGLTQKAVSAVSKVHNNHIIHVETGQLITKAEVVQICKALHVDSDMLALLNPLIDRSGDEFRDRGGSLPVIKTVVDAFGGDGLTTEKYLALMQSDPGLLSLRPESIIAKVNCVVDHFGKDGLTKKQYLRAVQKQPMIIHMKAETVINNIAAVVGRYATDGLTTSRYLCAAAVGPYLYSSTPTTICQRIELIRDMHKRGIIALPRQYRQNGGIQDQSLEPVLGFLLRNPNILAHSDEMFQLREMYKHVTGVTSTAGLNRIPRKTIEREMMAQLGHDDPGSPAPPNEGFVAGGDTMPTDEQATRFVLRALIHERLLKSGKLER